MTLNEFRKSLIANEPPVGLSLALVGLWWDAKGDWKRAHESAQQDEGVEGSWVHAYLHRKEGDLGNAAYWYSRAGKPVCRESLDAEWIGIVKAMSSRSVKQPLGSHHSMSYVQPIETTFSSSCTSAGTGQPR